MESDNKVEMGDLKQEPLLPLSEARELLDIVYLFNALLQSNGNLSSTAKELGIGRRTLYDLMEKYRISCTGGRLSIELRPLLHKLQIRTAYIEELT